MPAMYALLGVGITQSLTICLTVLVSTSLLLLMCDV